MSIPITNVSFPYLVSTDAEILIVVLTKGHLTLSGTGCREGVDQTVCFFHDLATRKPEFVANNLPLYIHEKRVNEMARLYRIPFEVHLLVPTRVDRVFNPPVG